MLVIDRKSLALFPNLMRYHLAQPFFSAPFLVSMSPDSIFFFLKLVWTNFERNWPRFSAYSDHHTRNTPMTSIQQYITFSSFRKFVATLCFS